MKTNKKFVEVKVEDGELLVLIQGLPHISIRQSEFVGYQSWIEGDDLTIYKIEFYMKGRDFSTYYDKKEKWILILEGLKKIHPYHNINKLD